MSGLIGSRKSITIIYKKEDGIFVSCGCFKGTFAEFEAKVMQTYPDKDNQYRKEYDKLIKRAKAYFKDCKKGG